jgi:nucleoid-associated protein YgaU
VATAAAAEKNSISQLAALRPQIQSLESERTALQQQLAEAKAGAAAGSATAAAAQAESEAKLTTSLRSYNVLQGENETLKAAATKAATERSALMSERDDLQRQLAAAKAAPATAQADADARLATALRSYSLLQSENDALKADARKAAADKAALETQLDPGHAQVRELQAQATALAAENAQLKTRLALVPPPAATAPTRPVATAAVASRTHVITEGDTLAKISRLYYGTTSRWPEILAANRDALRDERSLIVGHTLVIP